MKKIIIIFFYLIFSSNLMAAGGGGSSSGGDGGGEDVSKSNYKQAVSFIKRAGKLEKKNKQDKATKLYSQAFKKLEKNHSAYNGSIYDFSINEKYDLTLSSGVLIHQDPSMLEDFYEKLFNLSRKYILLNEYHSPYPVELE